MTDQYNIQLNEEIKRLCALNRISLKTLCAHCKITHQGYYTTFKNKSIKLKTLLDIAEFFNINVISLISFKTVDTDTLILSSVISKLQDEILMLHRKLLEKQIVIDKFNF